MNTNFATIDGNEAVTRVAYRINEVIAIYPITPSSAMGEWADTWSSEGRPNLWGTVPSVIEMQSEGGACGVCSWSITNRLPDNDIHIIAGIAVDDSQSI